MPQANNHSPQSTMTSPSLPRPASSAIISPLHDVQIQGSLMNDTIQKFGYPESLILETSHWVVLLRAKQVTIGSLVLACKGPAQTLAEISTEAAKDMPLAVKLLEDILQKSFSPNKINYLALMMVDPHVHFHVIPRYSSEVELEGTLYKDTGWPKHPAMTQPLELTTTQLDYVKSRLLANSP